MQKVVINASLGGNIEGGVNANLVEKDFNLEISKLIYDKLRSLGVDAYLVRDDDSTLSDEERLSIINQYLNGDSGIVLTNKLASGLDSGAEVIYALKDADTLAMQISNSIESLGQNILKFYQLRDPNNTALDFYSIIREVPEKVESLIVSYGYLDSSKDIDFLQTKKEELATNIALTIYDYLNKNNIYVVKEGDSLYTIARKYETTVAKLKELNNLVTNNLAVGQELIIPSNKQNGLNLSEQDFLIYTVKPGDTLYTIARANNTTIDVLKEINNLESDNLNLGEILKIPTKITNEDMENYQIYVVKPLDNLYDIAKRFNVSVLEIKNLNGLSSDNLTIGEVLKIPNQSNKSNYFNYVVKKGDNLYKIANLYQTTVSELKNLNNLENNDLTVGKVLKVPKV